MFSSKGEELEKTKKETLEMLQTAEEHGFGEKKYFGGDSIGIADIAFGPVVYWLEVIEEAVGEGAIVSVMLC
ncbi:GLUTATHIONE S-TRANSFERASE [Salix viminalis]|uniref:GLUTATHIONE S-TRANSFERASE n=1 Tax=Salix viminalis TaxID=40686 RepID=A0A9Q0Z5A1_SALVM|nr:GLUTATHIONE S-TRANSFERASE [Salix viminalis]